jgi:hypothetical protein
MSLAIVTTTNEGNILAADSMETYRNAIGDVREGSQTRMKLFQVNKRVGAVACGMSFLENKNIYQHMLHFKRENSLENLTVEEIVDKLYDFFYEKFDKHLAQLAEKRKKEFEGRGHKQIRIETKLECITMKSEDQQGEDHEQKFCVPIIEILVAGHDPDGTNKVYKVTVPDPKEKNGIVLKLEKEQCGATWIGQTDVLVRIIRGWSPEVKRIKAIEDIPGKKKDEFMKNLDDQEYLINWGTMTVQDAVEFSTLAIKTTEAIQKITDGTWQRPGSSPGVGGAVDIAVTTPEKGFVWIQKKKIQVNGMEVDLDKHADLNTWDS